MEVKKSPQADLENKKNIFLEIGLMLALGTILFAFEWKVSGRQPADFVTVSEIPTEIERKFNIRYKVGRNFKISLTL